MLLQPIWFDLNILFLDHSFGLSTSLELRSVAVFLFELVKYYSGIQIYLKTKIMISIFHIIFM